jgi:hypothetical protein
MSGSTSDRWHLNRQVLLSKERTERDFALRVSETRAEIDMRSQHMPGADNLSE